MENTHSSEMFKRFDSNVVTDDVRKMAEVELRERENEIEKSIETLKELLKKEKDLTPCLDDKFLLMFLRVRKFNIQAACSLVKKHYMIRLKYPKMYTKFNPKSAMNVISEGNHYFLPYRSPNGCAILHARFGAWDLNLLTWEELLQFNLMCCDMAIQNPVTQICGVNIIIDLKGITWSHLFQCHLSALRCFVSTLEECTPVRNKATHIIHESSIFSMLYTLVKPMIREKIKNRIFFHGSDYSSLHRHLPPEILPEELGGKLSNNGSEDFYKSLLCTDEDFKVRQSYGYLKKK